MKVLLLDSIRSMQNIGAIFRNADGAGFDSVYLTGFCPTPPRRDIHKTALGAEKTVNWEYYKDPFEIITFLKKEGFSIMSVELTPESQDYRKLFSGIPEKLCLVLGNETQGVSQKILSISDEVIMIPMLGHKESLNVSVAAGIVMYATV